MISICIPTYEMRGRGKDLLKRSFDTLLEQTHTDFEVIISDNSNDDVIKDFCQSDAYKNLNIVYFKNPRKGMAPNTNEAMKKAKGDLIKILYMDDYLVDKDSLKKTVDAFTGYWLATGCEHDKGDGIRHNPHSPVYNKNIYRGENTIGSPSVITIKNEQPLLLFDENMTWLLDCDYYKRMYDLHGAPAILNDITVVIGTGDHQTTNIIADSVKKRERYYMAKKYKKVLLYWLRLW